MAQYSQEPTPGELAAKNASEEITNSSARPVALAAAMQHEHAASKGLKAGWGSYPDPVSDWKPHHANEAAGNGQKSRGQRAPVLP